MDFRPTDEQELLRRTVREFAETEIRPHVREWDQEQKFSADLMPKLASLGLLGIQYPEQYGGAGMSAIRLLHLHRGAGARRSRDLAVGRRTQRPVLLAHLPVRQRRAADEVPGPAGAGREARRVGTDRVDLRQ